MIDSPLAKTWMKTVRGEQVQDTRPQLFLLLALLILEFIFMLAGGYLGLVLFGDTVDAPGSPSDGGRRELIQALLAFAVLSLPPFVLAIFSALKQSPAERLLAWVIIALNLLCLAGGAGIVWMELR